MGDFAVPVRGGLTDAAIELLKAKSDANFTNIFYPGSAQAMSDVLSGRVPAIIDGLAGPIARGKLKMLAVTSHERVPLYPSVPTVAETVPSFAATGWFALVAPPRTSSAIVKQLSEGFGGSAVGRASQGAPGSAQRVDAPHVARRACRLCSCRAELWGPVIKRIGNEAR